MINGTTRSITIDVTPGNIRDLDYYSIPRDAVARDHVVIRCIHLEVEASVTPEDIETFRQFCRDGIAARIPPLPPCKCGAASAYGRAGRAACEEHSIDVYESDDAKPQAV